MSLGFVAGCDDDDDDLFVDVDGDGIPDDPNLLVWRANISGTTSYSSITGQATVEQDLLGGVAFDVAISMRGDVANVARPWHVHFGTCASGGGIVGAPASYLPMVTGTDGSAQQFATVSGQLVLGDPYHVNIHLSEAALDTIIACGDLVRSQ